VTTSSFTSETPPGDCAAVLGGAVVAPATAAAMITVAKRSALIISSGGQLQLSAGSQQQAHPEANKLGAGGAATSTAVPAGSNDAVVRRCMMIRHLTDGTVLDLVRGPHAYQWPNQQHAAGRQAGRQRRRGSRLSTCSRVSVKAEAERPWSSGRREFLPWTAQRERAYMPLLAAGCGIDDSSTK
jgi:hypothetical protein